MIGDPRSDEGDDLRAAELALGLLDSAEREPAIARADREPAFAAAYHFWLVRALALSGVTAVRPEPQVWDRIVANLPERSRTYEARTQRSRSAWLSAAAIAASFVIGWAGGHWTARPVMPRMAAATPTQPTAAARPLLALLTSEEGRAVLAVSFTPDDKRLATLPKSVEPGRKVPELWVIPAGGKPLSLGVLASADPSWRNVSSAARPYLQSGATLAVSLEPAGGSPTGLPTGPVILTGTLSEPS